jgi:hypothetical protein
VIRFYPLTDGHWELRTTFGQTIKPSSCFLDEHDQICFEAEFEVQQVQDDGHLALKKIKSVGLLHDHDLEIFSAFAKISENSCGSLGEFLWDQKIAIEPINSKDLPRLFHFIKMPSS